MWTVETARRLSHASRRSERTFASGSRITIVLNVLSIVATGLASMVAARSLGPSYAGQVFLFLTATLTIGVFSDLLGVYFSNSYFLATNSEPNSTAEVRATVLAYGLSTGLLAGVLFGCVPAIREVAFYGLGSRWAPWIFVNILGLALLNQVKGIFWGRSQFILMGSLTLLRSVGYFVLVVGVTYVLGWRDPLYLAAGNTLATWASLLPVLAAVLRRGVGRPDMGYLSKCIRFGWRASTIGGMGFAHSRVDQWLVNRIIGSSALGVYGVAVALAELIAQVPGMLGQVLVPLAASQRDEAQRTLRRSVLVMAGVGACSLVLVTLAPAIIRVLYGEQYEPSVRLLRYLLPGIVALSGVVIVSSYLSAMGYPPIQQILCGATLVANVMLNVALLPTIGVVGASVSSSVSYTFWLLGLVWFVRRRERLLSQAETSLSSGG